MKITVEGTEQQCNDLARRVRQAIENTKKASKYYPNARGSIIDHEGRMFINIEGSYGRDIVDRLVNEMLATLDHVITLHDICPRIEIDKNAEIGKIKSFYEAGKRGLAQSELFSLYDAWNDNIFKSILGGLRDIEK